MQAEIRAFLASLESQPSYSPGTRLAYAADLTLFYKFLQGYLNRPPDLSDLNPQSIASFLNSEKLNGKKPSTLLRRKAAIRLFKIFLLDHGYIPSQLENDEWLSEIPFQSKTSTSHLQFLNPDQIQALLRMIEYGQRPITRRDSAILALLLHTGLTVSKLISLDLTDVNLYAGKLHLDSGQGETFWHPLGPAAQYIERYIKEGRPDLNPYPGETALFISQIGSRLSRQGVWQILKHWGNLTQVSTPITPRVIRHTAALHLARSGLPLSQIQVLLGHSNPQSTQALLHRLEAADPDQLVSGNSALIARRE